MSINSKHNEMIWANFLNLGLNMWSDRIVPELKKHPLAKYGVPSDVLRFDKELWDDILKRMAKVGMNMVVIDLGEGLRYESHPELAAKHAWTPKTLRRELTRMRQMGLEPIPKLNFSTGHDLWLGPYSRCVSTPLYYDVCRELIAEVIELFDKPRFFHLGYDEENAHDQRNYNYVVIRQHELWWHDFYFFVHEVEKAGVRPWIWADYVWKHPETFFRKMPKSVVQSNWYYGHIFRKNVQPVKSYVDLETHGYDQIPTGSNVGLPDNFQNTVRFCQKHIDPSRLLGFIQTPWVPTLEVMRKRHMQAVELVGKVIKAQ